MQFPSISGCGLLLVEVGGLVSRLSWRRPLWVQFPVLPVCGPLLVVVWGVVPRLSLRGPPWVQFSAMFGWGLLRALASRVAPGPPWRWDLWLLLLAFLDWSQPLVFVCMIPCLYRRGPRGCCSAPIPARGRCWPGRGGPLLAPAVPS